MGVPVVVTGAAGFVGRHLLDLLLQDTAPQDTAPVAGWYHHDPPPAREHPRLSWMRVELLDRAAVERALRETAPDSIYHLAGAAHVGESWQHTLRAYQSNVLAMHHVLEGVRACGLRPRVLMTGSAQVYQSQTRPISEQDPLAPSSPYATSKLAQEMLARRAWTDDGTPTLIARSFNHTGAGHPPSYAAPSIARQIALIEAGRAEPQLRVGDLTRQRDLSDVRDVVRAYVAMMRSAQPGVPYNICSGRPLAIGSLVNTFIAHASRPVNIVQDPARFRPNDPPLLVGDHSRLTADTGWTPQIPLEQTISDLLTYWRGRVSAGEP